MSWLLADIPPPSEDAMGIAPEVLLGAAVLVTVALCVLVLTVFRRQPPPDAPE